MKYIPYTIHTNRKLDVIQAALDNVMSTSYVTYIEMSLNCFKSQTFLLITDINNLR